MDCILETGFAEIINEFQFKESTKEKGVKLVDANHMTRVREIKKAGKIIIEGFCIRQTSVNAEAYVVLLDVSILLIIQQ